MTDRIQTSHTAFARAWSASGPYSTFFVIDTSCLSSMIGVTFKPGGVAPFLPFSVAELQNRHVSLDTLWGSSALDLRDRLLAVDTPQARFSILEQWLLTRARRPLLWRPTLTFALGSLHTTQTISEIVEQTGLSSRRFIQIFHEAVGLTPKQFSRVKRFQEVLRLVEKGEQIVWADIALSCGYYDQAHFIHDFQEFCGLTPRTYLAQRGDYRNHVPLFD